MDIFTELACCCLAYLFVPRCGSLTGSSVCQGIGPSVLMEHTDGVAGVARAQRVTINKGLEID